MTRSALCNHKVWFIETKLEFQFTGSFLPQALKKCENYSVAQFMLCNRSTQQRMALSKSGLFSGGSPQNAQPVKCLVLKGKDAGLEICLRGLEHLLLFPGI